MQLANRAALLQDMREPLRERARQSVILYRELNALPPQTAEEIPADMLEREMNNLWLQSVTDGEQSRALYYHSPLWKRICQEVLLRDGHSCIACHRDAELVHHRSYSYDVMVGLDDSQLISLCNSCHRYIHFHKMQKIPMKKWEKRLKRIQRFFARKRKWARIIKRLSS